MKGVGGPLLSIGDLLADLAENKQEHVLQSPSSSSPLPSSPISDSLGDSIQSVDVEKLFQENFRNLDEALSGTDHSWTTLTLKLCTAMETANKLVQATNSNARLVSEKVGELEKIVKRGDSAVAAAKAIHHVSLTQKGSPFGGSGNIQ